MISREEEKGAHNNERIKKKRRRLADGSLGYKRMEQLSYDFEAATDRWPLHLLSDHRRVIDSLLQ